MTKLQKQTYNNNGVNMKIDQFEQIFCPRCLSNDLELHSYDREYAFARFLCCNCFYRFSNYDFILNTKIRYRTLVLNIGEASYDSIVKNVLKNLAFNGILNYMKREDLTKIMHAGISEEDSLIHLSRLETNLQHFNNIKAVHNDK